MPLNVVPIKLHAKRLECGPIVHSSPHNAYYRHLLSTYPATGIHSNLIVPYTAVYVWKCMERRLVVNFKRHRNIAKMKGIVAALGAVRPLRVCHCIVMLTRFEYTDSSNAIIDATVARECSIECCFSYEACTNWWTRTNCHFEFWAIFQSHARLSSRIPFFYLNSLHIKNQQIIMCSLNIYDRGKNCWILSSVALSLPLSRLIVCYLAGSRAFLTH